LGGQCRRRTTHPLPDPPLERAGVFPSPSLPLKENVHDGRSPVKLAHMLSTGEGAGGDGQNEFSPPSPSPPPTVGRGVSTGDFEKC